MNSPKNPSSRPVISWKVFALASALGIVILLALSSYQTYRLLNKHKGDFENQNMATSSPSPVASPQYSKPSSQDAQTWMLSTGAIIAYQNDEGWKNLSSNISKSELKVLVKDWWDITDRDTAMSSMNWLKYQGHRQQFEAARTFILAVTNDDPEVFKEKRTEIMDQLYIESTQSKAFMVDFVWAHRHDLANKQLIAWDLGRLVNVSRWSYTLGYITEEEAWENISYAAQEIQKHHSSWEDFGDTYLLGRVFWLNNSIQPEARAAEQWLKTNPNSPWKKLPWDLPLRP